MLASSALGDSDDGFRGLGAVSCVFCWLFGPLVLSGGVEEARTLFDRLPGRTDELGLIVEEYDVRRMREVGSFPQASQWLTLIGAARSISTAESANRGRTGEPSISPCLV